MLYATAIHASYPAEAASPTAADETRRLDEIVTLIRSHHRSSVEVARGVREVINEKLYRHRYASLDAFAEEEFGYASRNSLYYLKTLADVADNVAEYGDALLDAHARALSDLSPSEQHAVIERAHAEARRRNGRVTVADIESARVRRDGSASTRAALAPAEHDDAAPRFYVRVEPDAPAMPAGEVDWSQIQRPSGRRPRGRIAAPSGFTGRAMAAWDPVGARGGTEASSAYWQSTCPRERVFEASALALLPAASTAQPVVALEPTFDLFAPETPAELRALLLDVARERRTPLAVFTRSALAFKEIPEGVVPVYVATSSEEVEAACDETSEVGQALLSPRATEAYAARAIALTDPSEADLLLAATHFDWVVVGSTGGPGKPVRISGQTYERLAQARARMLFADDVLVARCQQEFPPLYTCAERVVTEGAAERAELAETGSSVQTVNETGEVA